MADSFQGNGKIKVLILFFAFFFATGALAQTSQKPPVPTPAQKAATAEAKPAEVPNVLVQLNGALENLAARVSPAVVQILVTGFGPLREEDRSQTSFIVRACGGIGCNRRLQRLHHD